MRAVGFLNGVYCKATPLERTGSESMHIWLAIALLSAFVAGLFILAGLRRRAATDSGRAAHELEVHRAQLRELERDFERGLIDRQEVVAAKTEISRKILKIEDRKNEQGKKRDPNLVPIWGLVALGLAVPMASLALYLLIGNPSVPGRPYAERQKELLAIAEEQKALQPVVDLEARLTAQLELTPDDAAVWYGLGQARVRLGRYEAASDALRRALQIDGSQARYHAGMAEALILANGGDIVPGARRALVKALEIDPTDQRARFFFAIALSREGQGEAALAELFRLLREAPADAVWRPGVLAAARELAAELDRDLPDSIAVAPQTPPSDGLEGLDEDQRQMIGEMVEGLAARLEAEPDDSEGWQRLGRSYAVLGDADLSANAYSRAADLLPDDAAAQEQAAMAWVKATQQGEALPKPVKDYFERTLALDPMSIDALFFLGEVARQQQDSAAARDYWIRLLPLLPTDSEVHAFVSAQLDRLAP